jgi:carboxylate-amine ligase
MPDPDTAIRAFNGLRAYLPLLQGLSANSPFWFGRDSGLASARSALVRSYPGRGVPRAFRDFDEWAETVEVTSAAGHLDDYTFLWWDVRPHPRLGTVEIREMDAQSGHDDVAAIAALIHALAMEQAEARAADHPPHEAIAYSSFRASRDGLEATILDGGQLRPLREVARETVERLRPHAAAVGADGALEEVARLLASGGGAGRQRAAHANGGMASLLEHLVQSTRP